MHIMRMQTAGYGISQCSINIRNCARRNSNAVTDAIIESRPQKAAQHEIVLTDVQTLRKGCMTAEALIDLGFKRDPLTPGGVDLHDQMRVLGMQENSRIVAAAENRPWQRQRLHPHGIMGVHTSKPKR